VSFFFTLLLVGFVQGCLYALIALGYSLVFGILQFINFAHSDVVMLGAWFAWKFAQWMGVGFAAVSIGTSLGILLLAMLACAVLGFTIERFAYRPLRDAPRINILITAIGVSLFLENFTQLPFVFGSRDKAMPNLVDVYAGFDVGGVRIQYFQIVTVALAFTLMTALSVLVYRTRLGRAMRAISFDTRTASLMGIPTGRVIAYTFVLGSMLAATAGILTGVMYGSLSQPSSTSWIRFGLKAFICAVVGGIGSIEGAVAGGLLIGVTEQLAGGYISSSYADAIVFGVLILVLMVRPSGIFGVTMREKV
jgi:branched-chain amino acid transport system permease protein